METPFGAPCRQNGEDEQNKADLRRRLDNVEPLGVSQDGSCLTSGGFVRTERTSGCSFSLEPGFLVGSWGVSVGSFCNWKVLGFDGCSIRGRVTTLERWFVGNLSMDA